MTLVVALGISFAVLSPADATTKIVVSGTVAEGSDVPPGPFVKVCARSASGRSTCTTTDEDSRYRLALAPGTYTLTADGTLENDSWLTARYANGQKVSLTTSRTIDWTMEVGARIIGQLFDPVHEQLVHTDMVVRAYAVDAHGRTSKTVATRTKLNPAGTFDLNGLPAGRYRVRVTDTSYKRPYGGQWYPNASSSLGAEDITVTHGEVSEDHRMTLGPASRLTVRTVHRGANVYTRVALFDKGGHEVEERDTRRGSVSFSGLHSGTYKVRLTALRVDWLEWYSGARSFDKARGIGVGTATTTSRTATLHYPTLKATKRPTIDTFGDVVRVRTHGRWNARPAKGYYGYRWYRDGKKLSASRSDGDRLRLRDSDRGHRFKVCITATRTDHAPGTSCSRYTGKVRW